MTTINENDLIYSITDALQFISYYHPVDFIQSIVENKHRIIDTATNHEVVEIFKE